MTTSTTGIRGHQFILSEITEALAAHDLVRVLDRSERLAQRAGRTDEPGRLLPDLSRLAAQGTVASLIAMESAARLSGDGAGDFLLDRLTHPERLTRRHAAWRLGSRRPATAAYTPLAEMTASGGMDTLHAFRTLRRWAQSDPDGVFGVVQHALELTDDGLGRARLVDLLGSISHPRQVEVLAGIADADDHDAVRIAAVGALGELRSPHAFTTLARHALDDGRVGLHAALALDGSMSDDQHAARPQTGSLRIAQLVLSGDLDGQLSLGGRGDTGGVASLLVSLGEALARRDDVDHVVTIGRGTPIDALTSPMPPDRDRPSYGMIAVDTDRTGDDPGGLWEHLPSIERGLRRQLRMGAPIDVLHLRMADVGTLAGAAVATQLQLPICFSVAPDPHNVLRSLQSRGELDLDTFADLDATTQVWFRARLVERLTREAECLALFPRARPSELFGQLGVHETAAEDRAAVVAEGIDVDLIRRAEAGQRDEGGSLSGRNVIDDLGDRIPADRRHLPLLVSVGRLNPVKGMERVARTWATDPGLRERCNLVIVGGDLSDPSPTERAVLAAIDDAVPQGHPHRAGLVLLGGRPRSDIATLLVAAVTGSSRRWAPGGVYVDGALKEEFGLAVIEALAAGLVVVAPSTGGPPTYVDHGDTGILADPDSDLAEAVHDAFDLVDRPGRAGRARAMVEQRYSIDTMAGRLAALYGSTVYVP